MCKGFLIERRGACIRPLKGQVSATGTAVALHGRFTTAEHMQGVCKTQCIQTQKITALGFMRVDILDGGEERAASWSSAGAGASTGFV